MARYGRLLANGVLAPIGLFQSSSHKDHYVDNKNATPAFKRRILWGNYVMY